MREMSRDEWRAFLMAGTRTAKLATVDSAGNPRVKPVWYLLDGDDIVFNTSATTAAGRALLRDPRAAVCVDDDAPPFSFVIVRGRVTISEDPVELRDWATRIAARYMGPELGEQYGARNGVPGELLVRLVPERVVAEANLSD